MPVIWDSSHETGHAEIDFQHRELLGIVMTLQSAEENTHGSPDVILSVLAHFMDFTVSHFMMEEELMAKVEYPEEPRQHMIGQHREFTSYSRLRVLEFRKGELLSVLPLQAFLAEWLAAHEFGMDKQLAEYIRAQG